MKLLVTGGAGFIGSSFVRRALASSSKVVVLDSLTYAGDPLNLDGLDCEIVRGSICDLGLVSKLFLDFRPDALLNFAAESHVDNSITGPKVFVETNVVGTFTLLESWRANQKSLPAEFRFIHISTDEVFGDLGLNDPPFTEKTPYHPHSPYSATKAASDHLVRAWVRTYGLPGIVTNCSNNYGPRQFPEKLIPRVVDTALSGKAIPVYGKGANVRDWIHVEDHVAGIELALLKGRVGETYCFGGESERTNLQVVRSICDILDRRRPQAKSYHGQITFVEDRAGHDLRYAIDNSKAKSELGFKHVYSKFEQGLEDTVDWYLANQNWVDRQRERQLKRSQS